MCEGEKLNWHDMIVNMPLICCNSPGSIASLKFSPTLAASLVALCIRRYFGVYRPCIKSRTNCLTLFWRVLNNSLSKAGFIGKAPYSKRIIIASQLNQIRKKKLLISTWVRNDERWTQGNTSCVSASITCKRVTE